jgi:adenylosuccinate synthase
VNENAKLAVGAGVLVDVKQFLLEVEQTKTSGRVFLDGRCAVIEEEHKRLDTSGNSKKLGTTGSGCGPANAARINRTAKQAKDFPELSEYLADVPFMVNESLQKGKDVLVEATQGFGLSLYYGNYPYVTSKDTSASTACADIGLGPTRVDDVYIVFKVYMSRVGEDPCIHYLTDDEIMKDSVWKSVLKRAEDASASGETANQKIAAYFGEKGTVTGRLRKIAAFDYRLARYSAMVNGATQAAVTCVDKMFLECAGVRSYDNLSSEARKYLKEIEKAVGVKVTLISTGPDVYDVVDLRGT